MKAEPVCVTWVLGFMQTMRLPATKHGSVIQHSTSMYQDAFSDTSSRLGCHLVCAYGLLLLCCNHDSFVLQEESRRLQVQSQVLQQRAMAMSVRMSNSGTCPDEPTDASNTAAASTSHYLSSDTDAASPAPAAAIVPLSQVTDLQAAMAGVAGSVSGSPRVLAAAGHLSTGMSEDQYAMPASQANSVIAMSEGEAEHYLAQLQAAGDGGGLVPPDGMLPCHPPGDVTPSSVTSSRAGLHWNIPSRGSIPSPGKVDSRGSPRWVP